ncbi:MAG: DUF4337 domain-containing protein [Chitinophagaceae bacterium]|nr:DUF4337 domain-containing protein [Oligoflexus sp.]
MTEESLETSELQERLQESVERLEEAEERSLPKWTIYLSLSTAIIAVLAALASLESGAFSNEALLEKNDALLSQTKASDQWSLYQAKGIKYFIASTQAETTSVSNPALSEKLKSESVRYKGEQKEIEETARELEAKSKESNELSEKYLEKHHSFAYSVTFFQVSIALGAIAALTKRRVLWYIGLGCAVFGISMAVMGLQMGLH